MIPRHQPLAVRLEVSTVCQLRCPSCPTTTGEIHRNLGAGFLTFENFKRFLNDNPWVFDIELSNWGEIFLNPDLLKVMEYARRMLQGKASTREDIPCSACPHYLTMQKEKEWLTQEDVSLSAVKSSV